MSHSASYHKGGDMHAHLVFNTGGEEAEFVLYRADGLVQPTGVKWATVARTSWQEGLEIALAHVDEQHVSQTRVLQ